MQHDAHLTEWAMECIRRALSAIEAREWAEGLGPVTIRDWAGSK